MKNCRKCKIELNESNWKPSYKRMGKYLCKTCNNEIQKNCPGYKARQQRNNWKRQGINIEQVDHTKIKGNCEICGCKQDKDLCVDHDHKTGDVRGYLCNKCNSFIGLAKDCTTRLAKAIEYLNKK